MDSFFITLPSNSSMEYHSNTTAHFKTVLPKPIHLKGEYEVALLEMHYPQTLYNFIGNRQFITYIAGKDFYDEIEIFYMPDGVFLNTEQLFEHINNLTLNGEKLFSFEMDKKNVTFKVLTNNGKIKLSPILALQLGFLPDMVFTGKSKANSPCNLNIGIPKSFYVYCDIVEPQYVGDVMTRLLRVVRVDMRNYTHGSQISEAFTVPQYIHVAKRSFQEIEININDDTGIPAPFLTGTSTIVLHFRRATS
jgi:hypothetical protein